MSQPESSPEITPEVVRHLASLATISLTDAEVASLTTELSLIVQTIATVSEVATPDIPATSHPIPLANVYRPDEVDDARLSVAEALSGAPEQAEGMFVVSAILGEEQ